MCNPRNEQRNRTEEGSARVRKQSSAPALPKSRSQDVRTLIQKIAACSEPCIHIRGAAREPALRPRAIKRLHVLHLGAFPHHAARPGRRRALLRPGMCGIFSGLASGAGAPREPPFVPRSWSDGEHAYGSRNSILRSIDKSGQMRRSSGDLGGRRCSPWSSSGRRES
ncbi:hypothetical protein HPB51_019220 [Rhipicephalus microplus]|uniref:Uncharacterized protein n=1 Tax=Rhipicephalus microplus TaxID=6941 RepID=A0A9J6DBL1_RHIMP|nr:hypothetical protein HPB51_019220 [Rhipicephalus microplus]